MSQPLIMHVNYCEQGQSIEEICQKAVDWGFDGVEFRRSRRGVAESVEEYLDAIAAGVEKSGLKQVLFGGPGPNLMTSDSTVRANETESYANFFRLATQRFNLTVINAFTGGLRNSDPNIPYVDYSKHGSGAATEDHWNWAVEGYKVLGPLAEELGFRFAFEIHMGYLHDLPSPTRKLVDLIDSPAVGANLDYGNVVYFRGIPSLKEAIDELGDKLYYVHLKNSVGLRDGSRFPTGLGEGQINHREYLLLLKDSGYSGPICIEAPRAGDREWYAKQDAAYIKSVLKDLNW
jgi:sugar phosphate isomerase/epimerase